MKLEEKAGADHTILRVEGSLKLGETARAFSESCTRIADERRGALVLDLTHLDYMDSTGVGVLVGALRRFQSEGRDVLLAGPQRRILTGLRITHLDTLFRIYETLDEALASIAEGTEDTSGA